VISYIIGCGAYLKPDIGWRYIWSINESAPNLLPGGPFSPGNARTMPTDRVPDNARRESRQSFESVSSITDNNENRDTCTDNMRHNEHSAALETTSNDQAAPGLEHHEQAEEETSSRFNTSLNKGKYSVLRRSWKTSTGVVGFYLLGKSQCSNKQGKHTDMFTAALSCAGAHLGLFTYLNGKIINLKNEELPYPSTTSSASGQYQPVLCSIPVEGFEKPRFHGWTH
jgi:hypothetical protein